MKRKRNIITIDGYGKVAMPTDINTTAMTEVVLQDSCKLNSQMCNGYQSKVLTLHLLNNALMT